MQTFTAVLAVAFYIGFICLCIFGFKYLLAGITILTGDKESLKDFGNLCDKSPAPHWKYHEEQERRKEAERRWMIQHGYDWRKKNW
jgi:hypothetical protein